MESHGAIASGHRTEIFRMYMYALVRKLNAVTGPTAASVGHQIFGEF